MHSEPSKAAMERALDAMREDHFVDDAHLLGTTQQDARMEHYATVALAAAGYTITKEPTV